MYYVQKGGRNEKQDVNDVSESEPVLIGQTFIFRSRHFLTHVAHFNCLTVNFLRVSYECPVHGLVVNGFGGYFRETYSVQASSTTLVESNE